MKKLQEFWSKNSKIQKLLIVLLSTLLLLGLYKGKSSKKEYSRESLGSPDYSKSCAYCGSRFSHSGVTSFTGTVYCSNKCYVDGDGK
jgi:hypothetical protein